MKLSKSLMEAVRALVDLVGADNIQEIEIERRALGGSRIRVVGAKGQAQAAVPAQPAAQAQPEAPKAAGPEGQAAPDESALDGLHTIPSPMVGMFYRTPSPESPPYVEEGDVVSSGQTLCIIEAMKIMNEIESDIQGRVVRILVENGTPVEYNTPLFLLEPL